MNTEFNLHISIKAQNGYIYEDLGKTTSLVGLPALYDQLANQLGAQLHQADTLAGGNKPKITLIRQDTTHYDSMEELADALSFLFIAEERM